VVCFKPFKITFGKERNTLMVSRNYIEPDKITLVGWVDKAVDQTFTRKKSYQGSKVPGFGHLTLGPWMRKLALVPCTHWWIKLGKKNLMITIRMRRMVRCNEHKMQLQKVHQHKLNNRNYNSWICNWWSISKST
jgi:hypothetical protein